MSLSWSPSPAPVSLPQVTKRLLVVGGFGAGKSTAINLMMRRKLCATSIAARPRPIVHLYETDGAQPWGVPVDEDLASDPSLERVVRLDHPALAGRQVSEIQTDRPEDITDRVAGHLERGDQLIWCTIASQAWRQSERLTFDAIKRVYSGPAHLVVTRADLLRSAEDQEKIRLRLVHETKGLFQSMTFLGAPELLLDQLGAPEIWRQTGAGRLPDDLTNILGNTQIDGIDLGPLPKTEQAPGVLPRTREPSETVGKATPKGSPASRADLMIASMEAQTTTPDDIPAPTPNNTELPQNVADLVIESGADTAKPKTPVADLPIRGPLEPAPEIAETIAAPQVDAPAARASAAPYAATLDRIAALVGFEALTVFVAGTSHVVEGRGLSGPEMERMAVIAALLLIAHGEDPVEEAALLGHSKFTLIMVLPGGDGLAVAARFDATAVLYAPTRLQMSRIIAARAAGAA
ncbi:MAG: hypothetical protein AAGI13_05100 [Pseudomonadota bacterium]